MPNGRRRFFGYTPNMLRVAAEVLPGEPLTNRISMTRIEALAEQGNHLIGRPL